MKRLLDLLQGRLAVICLVVLVCVQPSTLAGYFKTWASVWNPTLRRSSFLFDLPLSVLLTQGVAFFLLVIQSSVHRFSMIEFEKSLPVPFWMRASVDLIESIFVQTPVFILPLLASFDFLMVSRGVDPEGAYRALDFIKTFLVFLGIFTVNFLIWTIYEKLSKRTEIRISRFSAIPGSLVLWKVSVWLKEHLRQAFLVGFLVLILTYAGWAIGLTSSETQPKVFISVFICGLVFLLLSPLLPALKDQDSRQKDWLRTLPMSLRRHHRRNERGIFLLFSGFAFLSFFWSGLGVEHGWVVIGFSMALALLCLVLKRRLRRSFIPVFISIVILSAAMAQRLFEGLKSW